MFGNAASGMKDKIFDAIGPYINPHARSAAATLALGSLALLAGLAAAYAGGGSFSSSSLMLNNLCVKVLYITVPIGVAGLMGHMTASGDNKIRDALITSAALIAFATLMNMLGMQMNMITFSASVVGTMMAFALTDEDGKTRKVLKGLLAGVGLVAATALVYFLGIHFSQSNVTVLSGYATAATTAVTVIGGVSGLVMYTTGDKESRQYKIARDVFKAAVMAFIVSGCALIGSTAFYSMVNVPVPLMSIGSLQTVVSVGAFGAAYLFDDMTKKSENRNMYANMLLTLSTLGAGIFSFSLLMANFNVAHPAMGFMSPIFTPSIVGILLGGFFFVSCLMYLFNYNSVKASSHYHAEEARSERLHQERLHEARRGQASLLAHSR